MHFLYTRKTHELLQVVENMMEQCCAAPPRRCCRRCCSALFDLRSGATTLNGVVDNVDVGVLHNILFSRARNFYPCTKSEEKCKCQWHNHISTPSRKSIQLSWKFKMAAIRSFCAKRITVSIFPRNLLTLPGRTCSKRNLHNSTFRNRSNRHEYDVEYLPYSKTRLILRPLAFTLIVSSGSFAAAAIMQYETIRSNLSQYDSGSNYSHINKKFFKFRQQLNKWWNALHPGEKTASAIIALNVGVFLLWRIPTLQRMMTRWFIASPLSGSSLPMLLSGFSHMESWHLACNMVVLWSFSTVIHDMLGREQFLAFYVSGGLCSAYFSHLFKLITSTYTASLGASGCILAVLGAVCVANPDTQLSIIFLPFFTFSASKALIGLVSIDLAGLLFRWRLFDHAAHLGGVAFGSWYITYGHNYIWDKRQEILQKWHEFRQKYTR